jgi:hypothetical protein
MPRKPRVVAAGGPHHVTQRGNHRQDILPVDEDSRFYLAALAENRQRYGLRVLGCCLGTASVGTGKRKPVEIETGSGVERESGYRKRPA